MNAMVRHEYGPPDVLHVEEISKPAVGDGDVLLVHVRAASVSAGDRHLMRSDPFLIRLMFGGLLKPKFKIIGSDVSGTVERVGRNVGQFEPGDEVFGDLLGRKCPKPSANSRTSTRAARS